MISDEERKCYYYDKGYCKNRNNCKLLHPTEDCKTKCSVKECKLRHRRDCKDGNNCLFKNKKCEYVHPIPNLFDVTLVSRDDQQKKTIK